MIAALCLGMGAPASAQSDAIVLLVNPRSGVKSVADFVAWVKRSKKPLAYSSSDPASQRIGDALAQKLGIKTVHVPYRAASQGVLDLIGGHIDFSVVDVGAAVGQIQGGLVTAIAVAGKQRFPGLPDVPTFAEAGFPELLSQRPDHSPWPLLAHARY